MKNKIVVIFLLLLVLRSFGQDSIDNKLCIKIAPLALLDIYSGMSPRIGVEYKLKRNISLYNEIGTYVPNQNSNTNIKGFLSKIELKAFLNRSGKTINHYISSEIFYKQQTYDSYDSISQNSSYYLKNYSVSKKAACLTLKYGFLKVFKFNLVLDAFVGLGVRFKFVESTLTNYENSNIKPEGSYSANIALSKAGNFTLLNLDMGIKIGYRIK